MNAAAQRRRVAPAAEGTSAAARRLMSEQLDLVFANEPGVLAGEVEPLHDMRVALRRLRTLLRAFGKACALPGADRMERRLDRLQKALGPARDADVLIAILESRSVQRLLTRTLHEDSCNVRPAGFDAPRRAGACSGLTFRRVEGLTLSKVRSTAPKLRRQNMLPPKRLLHEARCAHAISGLNGLDAREQIVERQRDLLRERKEAVRILLAGATCRRLKRDAAAFVRGIPDGTRAPALRRVAETSIRKALERIRKRTAMPPSQPPAAVHRLRIACRRARYLCEFFAPTLGKETAGLALRLKAMQDVLGDIHDLDVLTAELEREHVAVPPALVKSLAKRRARLLRRFEPGV